MYGRKKGGLLMRPWEWRVEDALLCTCTVCLWLTDKNGMTLVKVITKHVSSAWEQNSTLN